MKQEHQQLILELKNLGCATDRIRGIVSETVKAIEELSETVDDQQTTLRSITERFAEQESRALNQRDHWRAEDERWRECRESTVEDEPKAEQTTTDDEEWRQAMKEWKETQSITCADFDGYIKTCAELMEDRDAWRKMALALVEKINPPTP